uniref:Inhibitor I9 domain-containing protein n=1 Tax=Oryza brachyantha TaxID=4533 RepID=J3MFQ8_ORYBR
MEDTTSPAAARSTRARLVLAAVVSSLLLLQAPSTVAAETAHPPLPRRRRLAGGGAPDRRGVALRPPRLRPRRVSVPHPQRHCSTLYLSLDLDLEFLVDGNKCKCSREKAREAIFYSYTRNINGFAAGLEPEEAAAGGGGPPAGGGPGPRPRHDERQFMGLERGDGEVPRWSAWKVARYGEGAIIGNLDSGELHYTTKLAFELTNPDSMELYMDLIELAIS